MPVIKSNNTNKLDESPYLKNLDTFGQCPNYYRCFVCTPQSNYLFRPDFFLINHLGSLSQHCLKNFDQKSFDFPKITIKIFTLFDLERSLVRSEMSIGILGRKIGMTQVFDDLGNVIPVTVIEAGPCQVLKVKSKDGPDGYDAVVLGFGEKEERKLKKAEKGVLQRLGVKTFPAFIREIKVTPEEASLYPVGEIVDCSLFNPGEKVDVIGTTKGRGFTGVMKRHGFHGFPKTRGTHEFRRHPGAIGCRTWPGRVIKGMKMPGQHGNRQHTVLNLKVVAVYPKNNLIMVAGGVPGAPNQLVTVRKAIKSPLKRQNV